MTAHVGAKNQVTLPKEIVKQARLSPGDPLEIVYEDDRIVLCPQVHVSRSQSYFWTKEWQKGEREADEDIRAGRVTRTRDLKELFRKLDRGGSKQCVSKPPTGSSKTTGNFQ